MHPADCRHACINSGTWQKSIGTAECSRDWYRDCCPRGGTAAGTGVGTVAEVLDGSAAGTPDVTAFETVAGSVDGCVAGTAALGEEMLLGVLMVVLLGLLMEFCCKIC